MEFIKQSDIVVFSNSGVESHQLLFPENSKSTRITITKVDVAVGATNGRHHHAQSEQVWVALAGCATLLLAGDSTQVFRAGDVARFEPGDTHGLTNTGSEIFTYLSVTSPPTNFRAAYDREWR